MIRDSIWDFLKVRKRYWLLPIILMLLFAVAIIVFTSGPAVAPLVYTFF